MNSSGWNFDAPDSRPWKLDINTDGTATINTYQDVQPVIERNKLNLNNYGDKLTNPTCTRRHPGQGGAALESRPGDKHFKPHPGHPSQRR